jgi:hypothetical protein
MAETEQAKVNEPSSHTSEVPALPSSQVAIRAVSNLKETQRYIYPRAGIVIKGRKEFVGTGTIPSRRSYFNLAEPFDKLSETIWSAIDP